MKARTFMQVSIGILALAAAYHLGANSARAQASDPVVGLAYGSSTLFAGTANGNVYVWDGLDWRALPNVFAGATPAHATSFGELS